MEHSQSAGRGVYTHDDAVCGGRSLSEDRDWRDDGEEQKSKRLEKYHLKKKCYNQARWTRVNIRKAFQRWRDVTERDGLETHAKAALYL